MRDHLQFGRIGRKWQKNPGNEFPEICGHYRGTDLIGNVSLKLLELQIKGRDYGKQE